VPVLTLTHVPFPPPKGGPDWASAPTRQTANSTSIRHAWLPDITLIDLIAARQQFDIRFWRENDETKFEVLRGDAKAVERKTWIEQSNLLKKYTVES
jgi:hypothetical protein